ncbi:exodeoxyribonuclease VII large subunit [Pelagibius litoralis]|uniref:Exodeoxyribonuclease 7 large subunit n=1 Tax=Pelagibius litoralis TaxID=374515 RepID=A0A967KFA3_9PROT|nr:exodeoxyribonuclease VII large subunit [Pelagibius litoralis]NIA71190.1 exodeoxyribonuclease VII large subunit [Pelagibius litoralis]
MPANPPVSNVPEFSVSEVSQAVKRTLEGTFERVRVRGEVSGFKRAASGHLYLALKDENAVLDGVCWRGMASKLSIQPEDGMEVIVSGRITSYPGRSKYQIVIDSLELAGQGALLKLLEDRRRKLAEEGLFDEARKRALPFLPEIIGVVTSPTGAVIRDILHRLADRFPRRVLVWPVLVQGEGAAEQVAAAIQGFNALPQAGPVPRPDLLIVARGGGSLEDLWAFNEEVVVRAAAGSAIPLISAVGHETDTTLIDFASDRRAPTPTAAAEMAVPVRRDLWLQAVDLERRMTAAAGRLVEERRTQLEGLGRGLVDPRRLLEEMTQRLDERAERLKAAWERLAKDRQAQIARLEAALPHPRQLLAVKGEQLAAAGGRLETVRPRLLGERLAVVEGLGRVLESISYRKVLQRGYAVVRGPEGAITTPEAVTPGLALELEFAAGRATATGGEGPGAVGGRAPARPAAQPVAKAKKKKPPSDDSQGSLL